MDIDVKSVADRLILQLTAQSEVAKFRAEGVALLAKTLYEIQAAAENLDKGKDDEQTPVNPTP